ncbi:MAG: uracil-DNA glycosylase [Marivirga sp.]|jgi:uracil-DNA glycosylase
MDVQIHDSWKAHLHGEFEKPYFKELVRFVKLEYQYHTIFPKGSQIFNAFEHCSYEAVKVVIIGQDPYHGPGQANGLCFSVNPGVPMPPSLQNIFKERKADLAKAMPANGDLTFWADQGVLLLNATLTVREKSPGSHQNKGWEEFTDAVIKLLSDRKQDIVFLLWGAYAQKKGAVINSDKHQVISSAHPSPFAAYRGFYDSKPFSKTNAYLNELGKDPISW